MAVNGMKRVVPLVLPTLSSKFFSRKGYREPRHNTNARVTDAPKKAAAGAMLGPVAVEGRTETDGRRVPIACGERLTHLASRLGLAALLDVGVA
jgi:hypothetical protein